MLEYVEPRQFDFNDASLEAENARAVALDLIAAWLGANQIEPGPARNAYVQEHVFAKVLPMEWREMSYTIGSLAFIGSILARGAAQLPLALDELDVDADEFTEEHAAGDPAGYLAAIEQAIREELRGER